jgi:hypothetical protein
MFNMFRAATPNAKEGLSREWVAAVKKEIEPLLTDAKPYFGGSPRMTLAEVRAAKNMDFFIARHHVNGDLLDQRCAIHHAHLRTC